MTKKKTADVKKPAGFKKPVKVSAALAAIVGKDKMDRAQITKMLWKYIKDNDLQDKKNRRSIVPDQKLSAVLGKKPIDMFKMPKKVSEHIEEVSAV